MPIPFHLRRLQVYLSEQDIAAFAWYESRNPGRSRSALLRELMDNGGFAEITTEYRAARHDLQSAGEN